MQLNKLPLKLLNQNKLLLKSDTSMTITMEKGVTVSKMVLESTISHHILLIIMTASQRAKKVRKVARKMAKREELHQSWQRQLQPRKDQKHNLLKKNQRRNFQKNQRKRRKQLQPKLLKLILKRKMRRRVKTLLQLKLLFKSQTIRKLSKNLSMIIMTESTVMVLKMEPKSMISQHIPLIIMIAKNQMPRLLLALHHQN